MEEQQRLDRAALELGVQEKELGGFNVEDPFNEGNTIAGFICRRADHRYGALFIDFVNDKPTAGQVVFCTPKLRYPFGRTENEERKYQVPVYAHIVAYEKLDGTNICAYSYEDMDGERYVTFKTRLSPVVRNSTYGGFYDLWCEMLESHPELRCPTDVLSGVCALSFELYGTRNHHLVRYDTPLDCRLLFVIRQSDAEIFPPRQHTFYGHNLTLPEISGWDDVRGTEGFIRVYDDLREQAEARNTLDEENMIDGTEGYVLYIYSLGQWLMYKCKPASIEAVHWSGSTIPMSVILPTVWNATEDYDDLTVEYIKVLLLEEFNPVLVEGSHERIERAIEEVVARLEWRKRVRREYDRLGVSIEDHGKSAVMRGLSISFNRSEMHNVYNALKEMGLAE